MEVCSCSSWQGPRLSYLDQQRKESVFNIPIKVSLEGLSSYFLAMKFAYLCIAAGGYKVPVTVCNTKHVVFSLAQILAHHTVGGCPMRTGDLVGTGTLSGPTQQELGCLLEITRDGNENLEIKAEASSKESLVRKYLEDEDTVEFHAKVEHPNGFYSIGFGTCVGTILPST